MEQQNNQLDQKYTKIQKISQGSYGIVFKAKNKQTSQIVAIKKFKKIIDQGLPASCVRQINILNLLMLSSNKDSARTLRLYQTYNNSDNIQIVVEWLDITLSQLIQTVQYSFHTLFFQICQSLLELHSLFILHRDIKPLNIMKNNSTGIIKLIDYGMCKQYDFDQSKPLTNQVGSLYYRAPELLLGGNQYGFQIDIWAIGCVFYEILTKKILFKSSNQQEQIKKIFLITGTPKITNKKIYQAFSKLGLQELQNNWISIQQEIQDPKAFSLLKKMLNIDPESRPSISQILENEYFKESS